MDHNKNIQDILQREFDNLSKSHEGDYNMGFKNGFVTAYRIIDNYFEGQKATPKTNPDPVNHPEHYGGKDNPYEAIKVIEAHNLNFAKGNAVKYILRAGKKGDPAQDIKKAIWYLERELNNLIQVL